MPVKEVTYTQVSVSPTPVIYTTELGNTMVEIQGSLVSPDYDPTNHETIGANSKYLKFTSQDQGKNGIAIKVGKLEIDEEAKKATLYIGTTQRLLGDIKKVNPPLGLMRFPDRAMLGNADGEVELVDVIRNKIIFTGRPLPIM